MMNVKNLILGIGIFIVYLLAVGYGIEAFYPSPQYNDFCMNEGRYPVFAKPIDTVSNCTFSRMLQEQSNQCYAKEGSPVYEYTDIGCVSSIRECNYCNKYYNEARKAHEKMVFVFALILGIITLFLGFSILTVEPVGSALIASGIGAIFYGSMRNWENLADLWRFLLLLLALIFLIWITLRINKTKTIRKIS